MLNKMIFHGAANKCFLEVFLVKKRLLSPGGATSTRQNPNGNGRRRGGQRHGLECPEDGSSGLQRLQPVFLCPRMSKKR